MKKLLILSTLGLLSVGLFSQPVAPVSDIKNEAVGFDEFASDYNSEDGFKLSNKKITIGESSEVKVSPTFVQFGQTTYEGHDVYVVRYATAVKGDISSISYQRGKVEGKNDVAAKEVEVLYNGISASGETYYYDETINDVSTDEALKGQYYWACYTIRYLNGDFFGADVPLTISVNEKEFQTRTTSFDALYPEDGSETYPYLINTDEEWQAVIDEVNAYTLSEGEENIYVGEEKYYKLVNNINQTEVLGKDYIYFASVIDGNGYTITANISVDGERAALINRTSKMNVIKNLKLEGSISSTNAVEYNGAFVAASYGNLDNCVNNANLTFEFETEPTIAGGTGGIVGFVSANGSVNDCVNDGTITTNIPRVGGIVGRTKGDITNCTNNGQLICDRTVGGIVGHIDGSGDITNCKNTAEVSGKDQYVAGIAGYSKNGSVFSCTNEGKVTSTSSEVAGILGYGEGTVTVDSCTNNGDVNGTQSVAGIFAYAKGGTLVVKNSINKGNVKGTKVHVGSIVGMLGSGNSILDCYNYGLIASSSTTATAAGSIVGSTYSNNIITNCHTIVIDGLDFVGNNTKATTTFECFADLVNE